MAKFVIPEYLTARVRWLMLSRVVIITFILGLTAFVDVMKVEEPLSAISTSLAFPVILLAYLCVLIFLVLLKYIPSVPLNVYIQSIGDVALVTLMVYATGGIGSIYSVFYPLIIIYAVLFLGRKGGLIIASIAGLSYGLFGDLELNRVIYPFFSAALPDHQQNAGFVFTRVITHIISFYLIAVLASFVVEQERRVRKLLAEKQTAFDKLDLLHRSIIESVDTGILTVNLRGEIKSLNRAASDITGFSFPSVENKKFSEIFPQCPALRNEEVRNKNRTAAKTRFEMTFVSHDGRQLLLGGSVSPLRDPSGVTIGNIVIFQDLTTINEMKESLEKSRRLAFIGEMAASLAHEIRNPLASISGSIQMLKSGLVRNDTDARLVQIILRGKDQLESFLKDFLLIARPAPGIRETNDLRETITEVLESLHCVPDWHEHLIVDLSMSNEPLLLCVNKTEIRQVIWNLVLNAVQAMPEGGKLQIEAYQAKREGCDGVEILIKDSGCGISDRDLERIFEPFYTTRDTGTGLGLTVVNRIMEMYRGRIRLKSVPGEGTVFSIWIPAQEPSLVAEDS